MKHQNTFCSQCGQDQGPGNEGFSMCKDHSASKEITMKTEIETIIRTEADVRVSVSDFDDCVWLAMQTRHGSAHVVLNREEARQIIQGLQAILDAEVSA